MIVDEQIFLEHFGVKGMQWGQRKDRRAERTNNLARNRPTKKNVKKAQKAQRKADWKNRPKTTGRQKTAIAATSVGAAFVASRMTQMNSPLFSAAAVVGGAVVGKKVAQNQIAKYSKKSMSELS